MIKMRKVTYRIVVNPRTYTEDEWEARVFRVLDYGDDIEVEDYSWFVGYNPSIKKGDTFNSRPSVIERARQEIAERRAKDRKLFAEGKI